MPGASYIMWLGLVVILQQMGRQTMGVRLNQQLLQPQAQVQHPKLHRPMVGVILQAQAQAQLWAVVSKSS